MWQYSHFEWRLQGDLITYGSGGGGGGGGGNVLLGRRKVITASLEHKLEQKSARFAQQVTMQQTGKIAFDCNPCPGKASSSSYVVSSNIAYRVILLIFLGSIDNDILVQGHPCPSFSSAISILAVPSFSSHFSVQEDVLSSPHNENVNWASLPSRPSRSAWMHCFRFFSEPTKEFS